MEQCKIFCDRYKLLNTTCNHYRQQGKTKVIGYFSGEKWQSVWALPYESMSISALQNKATISIRSSEKSKWAGDVRAASDSLFLGAEFMPPWPQRFLNKRHFSLAKSTYFIDTAENSGLLKR
jgi:hypothetical protein